MPSLNLMHETFVVAPPEVIAARIGEQQRWPRWWPDLALTVFQDRGRAGVRWNVSGALTGSMEVWVEPFADGAIVHYYLRTEGDAAELHRRSAAELHRRALRAKEIFWALKDELEGDRQPGCPPPCAD